MFSEWVKQARVESGRSHSAVAACSGGEISASYVGHIETQTVNAADLTLKKLVGLARGLDLPAYEVVNAALEDALGGGAGRDRVEIIGRASHLNEAMELPLVKNRLAAEDVRASKRRKKEARG